MPVPIGAGWPGPAWPQMQPSVRIPLRGTPGRVAYQQTAIFSPSGDRVVVVEPDVKFWTLSTLRWHAPDIAGIALLITVLWLLKRIYSTVRAHFDERIIGHWYCRKCGYDLTPPGTDLRSRARPISIAPICSECGVHTAKKRPRRAVGRTTRLFPPVVALLLVAGAAAWTFDTSLECVPTASGMGSWPSPLLSRVLSNYLFLPTVQRINEYEFLPDAQTISIHDLPSGQLRARFNVSNGAYWQLPDDRWCVGLGASFQTGLTGDIQTIDLHAANPRITSVALPGPGYFALLIHQHDPRAMVYEEIARADGTPWQSLWFNSKARPTRELVLRLWSFNAESGAWTRLFEVPKTVDAPGALVCPAVTCWADPTAAAQPAFSAICQLRPVGRASGTTDFEVLSISRQEVQSHTFHLSKPYVIAGEPDVDGTSIPIYDQRSGSSTTVRFDIKTGAVSVYPAAAWQIKTPDGLLSLQYPAIPPRFVDPSGKVVGVPCVGVNGMCLPGVDASGRWAYTSQSRGWPPMWLFDAVGLRFRHTGWLYLWDLEPLKKPIRDAQPQPASPSKTP